MTAHPFKGGQHIFQAATLSFLTLDNFKSNYSAPDLDSCFERPRFENWLKYRFKIVQNFKNIKMLQIWRTVCKKDFTAKTSKRVIWKLINCSLLSSRSLCRKRFLWIKAGISVILKKGHFLNFNHMSFQDTVFLQIEFSALAFH